MRPSCGIRFSAMLRSAMTFSREISPPWRFLGCGRIGSWSTPSTRNRILTSRSPGSMCTSEARSATAWDMIAFTSLTIGASSRAASRSSSSPSLPSAASAASCSTWESRPANFWIACSTSAEVGGGGDVGGVRHRDEELPVALADREGPVPASERFRQERGGGGVDLGVVEVDELQTDLLGEGPDQVGLVDHAEVDEHA